jgi:hypothetical protein
MDTRAAAVPVNVPALIDHQKISGSQVLERIPVMWKRSLHVGSNWRILAD